MLAFESYNATLFCFLKETKAMRILRTYAIIDRRIEIRFSEELIVMNKRRETSKECRKAF